MKNCFTATNRSDKGNKKGPEKGFLWLWKNEIISRGSGSQTSPFGGAVTEAFKLHP